MFPISSISYYTVWSRSQRGFNLGYITISGKMPVEKDEDNLSDRVIFFLVLAECGYDLAESE
jgi:hypothetical protein